MKIVKAEVFVTCPGRNFVTLKITTEDGITGLGDATLNAKWHLNRSQFGIRIDHDLASISDHS
ncbi:hypothetical protein, partial [Escherichia coli]